MRSRFLIPVLFTPLLLLIPASTPSPGLPIPESQHDCSVLLRRAIYTTTDTPPLPSPQITYQATTIMSTHHHTIRPRWVLHGRYTSLSGPFSFQCSASLRQPTTLLHNPFSPFIGTPLSNTQCIDIRNAPVTTLGYIAFRLEQGNIADRRKLYHIAPCPPDLPPSMSATPEGN